MAQVFTSWGALQSALEQKVNDATAEVIDTSLNQLFLNVDRFYSSEQGRYQRLGYLAASPRGEFYGGGSVSSGEIRLDTGHVYTPSGRSTQQIYNYAESGGLLGNGGFWSSTVSKMPGYIQRSFGSRFL